MKRIKSAAAFTGRIVGSPFSLGDALYRRKCISFSRVAEEMSWLAAGFSTAAPLEDLCVSSAGGERLCNRANKYRTRGARITDIISNTYRAHTPYISPRRRCYSIFLAAGTDARHVRPSDFFPSPVSLFLENERCTFRTTHVTGPAWRTIVMASRIRGKVHARATPRSHGRTRSIYDLLIEPAR